MTIVRRNSIVTQQDQAPYPGNLVIHKSHTPSERLTIERADIPDLVACLIDLGLNNASARTADQIIDGSALDWANLSPDQMRVEHETMRRSLETAKKQASELVADRAALELVLTDALREGRVTLSIAVPEKPKSLPHTTSRPVVIVTGNDVAQETPGQRTERIRAMMGDQFPMPPNPTAVLGVPIARIAELINEDRVRRGPRQLRPYFAQALASETEPYLTHTDGSACHGTRLTNGTCPRCGITPDLQSTTLVYRDP